MTPYERRKPIWRAVSEGQLTQREFRIVWALYELWWKVER